MKKTIVRLAFALGAVLACGAAFAQATYPNHPVKIIAPFTAGGPTDLVARLLADKLSQSLHQKF